MCSILLFLLYVVVGGYLMYHVYQIMIIYGMVFKETKEGLLSKCASLNDISCPYKEEDDKSAFKRANEWRRSCRKMIDETNMTMEVERFEQRVLYHSILQYNSDHHYDHWYPFPYLNQAVVWLMEHHIEVFQACLLINLVWVGVVLWIIVAIYVRIYREQQKPSSSSSSITNNKRPINISSSYYGIDSNGLHHRTKVQQHPLS